MTSQSYTLELLARAPSDGVVFSTIHEPNGGTPTFLAVAEELGIRLIDSAKHEHLGVDHHAITVATFYRADAVALLAHHGAQEAARRLAQTTEPVIVLTSTHRPCFHPPVVLSEDEFLDLAGVTPITRHPVQPLPTSNEGNHHGTSPEAA